MQGLEDPVGGIGEARGLSDTSGGVLMIVGVKVSTGVVLGSSIDRHANQFALSGGSILFTCCSSKNPLALLPLVGPCSAPIKATSESCS